MVKKATEKIEAGKRDRTIISVMFKEGLTEKVTLKKSTLRR